MLALAQSTRSGPCQIRLGLLGNRLLPICGACLCDSRSVAWGILQRVCCSWLALEELLVRDVAEDFDEVFSFAELYDPLELLVFGVLEDVDVAESADVDADFGAIDGISLLVAAVSASLGVVLDVRPVLNEIDYGLLPPFILFHVFQESPPSSERPL